MLLSSQLFFFLFNFSETPFVVTSQPLVCNSTSMTGDALINVKAQVGKPQDAPNHFFGSNHFFVIKSKSLSNDEQQAPAPAETAPSTTQPPPGIDFSATRATQPTEFGERLDEISAGAAGVTAAAAAATAAAAITAATAAATSAAEAVTATAAPAAIAETTAAASNAVAAATSAAEAVTATAAAAASAETTTAASNAVAAATSAAEAVTATAAAAASAETTTAASNAVADASNTVADDSNAEAAEVGAIAADVSTVTGAPLPAEEDLAPADPRASGVEGGGYLHPESGGEPPPNDGSEPAPPSTSPATTNSNNNASKDDPAPLLPDPARASSTLLTARRVSMKVKAYPSTPKMFENVCPTWERQFGTTHRTQTSARDWAKRPSQPQELSTTQARSAA